MDDFICGKKVKIISGFYAGFTGILVQYQSRSGLGDYYLVRMDTKLSDRNTWLSPEEWVYIGYLERI